MREVKRFVLRRSGVDGVMPVNSSYEGIDKQYVLASDFDALAAENARLRAELDAIQGARGEEPLVVATAILGGLFHGGSGPELGEIDVEVCTPHLEKIQCETVNSSDDVFLPLMTVAQHQRITAAMAAELEQVRTALGGMLFAFDDGVGQGWSKEVLDFARTLTPAKEYKA